MRQESGATQALAAAYIGVNIRTLRRWESGESKPPRSAEILMEQIKPHTTTPPL